MRGMKKSWLLMTAMLLIGLMVGCGNSGGNQSQKEQCVSKSADSVAVAFVRHLLCLEYDEVLTCVHTREMDKFKESDLGVTKDQLVSMRELFRPYSEQLIYKVEQTTTAKSRTTCLVKAINRLPEMKKKMGDKEFNIVMEKEEGEWKVVDVISDAFEKR